MLQGEGVEFLGRAADALIAISNYRLHIKFKDSVINVSSCLIFLTPKSRIIMETIASIRVFPNFNGFLAVIFDT